MAVPRGGLRMLRWPGFKKPTDESSEKSEEVKDSDSSRHYRPPKWSLGILNDRYTDEVPGSVLLMSKQEADHNEPLGLQHVRRRRSASSLPSPYPVSPRHSTSSSHSRPASSIRSLKKTADGNVILEPQPDDSANDPLNWPSWRRDMALISLGFFCMLGGGMTPVLAAGFGEVAKTYHVTVPQVSLTTGLYMLGLGIGSVIFSPTAILYGKRLIYLIGGILFVIGSVWCALSPDYPSLVVARIFQGIAVSPVECLPSATIAEIYFLHERAYRLGIYTLLLLGGKNLVPLVSAAIINSLGWQWVFWIVGILVGFATILLFFFVPETFWDRTPTPSKRRHKNRLNALTSLFTPGLSRHNTRTNLGTDKNQGQDHQEYEAGLSAMVDGQRPLEIVDPGHGQIAKRRKKQEFHAHFADSSHESPGSAVEGNGKTSEEEIEAAARATPAESVATERSGQSTISTAQEALKETPIPAATGDSDKKPDTTTTTTDQPGYFDRAADLEKRDSHPTTPATDPAAGDSAAAAAAYTHRLASLPRLNYWQTLRPWNGRLRKESWLKCMVRPFVLYSYPAILWSAMLYSLSVGWLIVLSEAMTTIFRTKAYAYRFTALQTGLIYISPFVGGFLGTAVAGRISDMLTRAMARRNDGVYEPEFRLLMTLPILLSTVAGLMGFGWSAADGDAWIVPAVFFGLISFGSNLGSTTAITFAVDSYREYAGEALVTLNFSKNVLHGLVFSLFFTGWLEADGSKRVFLVIGGIQTACLLTTIPLYIYGKRLRMWTVRRNAMERF